MRAGDFADRGVHVARGGVIIVFDTPCLAEMRCRRCRARGVTVTAITEDDQLLGWCGLPHATQSGLRIPGNAKGPSPAPKRRAR
jgi:hypothetical protein